MIRIRCAWTLVTKPIWLLWPRLPKRRPVLMPSRFLIQDTLPFGVSGITINGRTYLLHPLSIMVTVICTCLLLQSKLPVRHRRFSSSSTSRFLYLSRILPIRKDWDCSIPEVCTPRQWILFGSMPVSTCLISTMS